MIDTKGSPHGCGRLSTDGVEPRRSGGGFSHGRTRLPCRRPDLRDPRHAASGIRQPDAVTRIAAGADRRGAGSLPPDTRWVGEDGMHAHPVGRREPAADAEGPPTRVELAGREEWQVEVLEAATRTRKALSTWPGFCHSSDWGRRGRPPLCAEGPALTPVGRRPCPRAGPRGDQSDG